MGLHEYICKNCGVVKEAKYESQKKQFCSHKCANSYRNKHAPKIRGSVTCQTCGKLFEVFLGDSRLKNGGVKYCSKKCSSEAQRTGSVVKCKQCGKEFYTTRNEFCSHRCANDYKSETADKKLYKENGYLVKHIRGYNKKGNAKLHRLVMEEHLGRKLESGEVVHHINGDITDNRIENLRVMTIGEHSSMHRKQEKANGKHLFGGYHNN